MAAEAFVQKLLQAVEKKDTATIHECTDYEALAEAICDGFPNEEQNRKAMVAALSSRPGGAFFNEVMGQPGRVVRHRERDGVPAVMLRFMSPTGVAFYCDVLLRRAQGGGFKAHDAYHYLLGMRMSKESHNIEAAIIMRTDEAEMLPLRGSQAERAEQMGERGMARACRDGRWREAIAFYHTLPSDTKNERWTFLLYVKALQKMQGGQQEEYKEEYVEALRRAWLILGSLPSSELPLLERHLLRADFPALQEAVELSLMRIGEDSHLLALRGIACVHTKDLKAARKSLKAAEKIEPDLSSLLTLKLMIRAAEKDYAGVVQAIQASEARTGTAMKPDQLADPIFDDFKKSPEFAEWSAGAGKN